MLSDEFADKSAKMVDELGWLCYNRLMKRKTYQ
jgi:hypothetical protein